MIRFEQVSYSHSAGGGKAPVLRDLSFSIPEGQWVSIAGPNGSGKSTLLKLINGLLRTREGRIIIDGTELTRLSVGDIRMKVGAVFQNPDHQSVGQTVAEDIVFGLENLCLDRETMASRLHLYAKRMGVAALLDRHPGQLSGGQKQRAALAAVLAMEPRIVLFDEATSMLDSAGKAEIVELLQEMRSSGKYTIVSVTHDVDELLASDRVLLLANGTVAADGAPKELLQQKELLAACRLKAPFVRQLGAALSRRGISAGDSPAGEAWDEEGMVEALWRYHSSK